MPNKSIIISPSGNFYGSEQVLFEFLKASEKLYHVYVPENSILHEKLKNEKKHHIKGFTNLYTLYLKLTFLLLFKSATLYINEGGHIRFVKLIAKLLPHKKFFTHIRILEDCSLNRLKATPPNVQCITVSSYLASKVPQQIPVKVIYDPYTLNNEYLQHEYNKTFSIGIIGRVTKTKGLDDLIPIFKKLTAVIKQPVHVNFFGTVDEKDNWFNLFIKEIKEIKNINIHFKGFVHHKEEIYQNIDLLLHLNKVEALGRILFEAVDYHTPYLTFNAGGCGELTKILGLHDFLIEDDHDWIENFIEKIMNIYRDKKKYDRQIKNARVIISNQFTSKQYAKSIETLLIK